MDKEERKRIDTETINSLLKHGADLNNEYLIDFFFVGDEEKLRKMEKILDAQGYKKSSESKESELLVQQRIKLDLMRSHLITESLESLANENDVSFDGWGTVAN